MEEPGSYEAQSMGDDPSGRSQWLEVLSRATHALARGGCHGERNLSVWVRGLPYDEDFSSGG